MASPITWDFVANCHLSIKLPEKYDFSKWRRSTNTYSITPPKFLHFKNRKDSRLQKPFEGKLSSIHRVTVPKGVRKKAEIPPSATYFCFMHPPTDLASLINWKRHKLYFSETEWNSFSKKEKRKAGQLFAILVGGYVYFDANRKLLCINALSFMSTENKLNFSGPWNITQNALNVLKTFDRFVELQLVSFAEAGLVSWAWVNPSESFGPHGLCVDEKQSHQHGSFVFLREDNTAFAYNVVSLIDPYDPSGRCEMVEDCFYAVKKCIVPDIDDIDLFTTTSKRQDLLNIDCSKNLAAKAKECNTTILHLACHAGLSAEEMENKVKEVGCTDLQTKDNFGFTPLHYACRFASKNIELIQWLVNNSGDAVCKPDAFNRSPLYLACAGQASKEVIKLLVKKYPKAKLEQTKTMGLTPLHIACFNQATREVLAILLEKDKEENKEEKDVEEDIGIEKHQLIWTKSSNKLPIHFAIESRMEVDAVDKLLQHQQECMLEPFKSMIPLHMACKNNSCPDIVQLLLEMDSPKMKSLQCEDESNMKPIHYAVNKTNADARIVKLLLDYDVGCNQLFCPKKVTCNDYHKFDKHTSPLWLACKESAPHEVIELLMSQPNVKYWEFSTRTDQEMLSSIVFENKKLQHLLKRKLAERSHFVRLNFRFILNMFMLVVFLLMIEELPDNEPKYWHILAILLCSALITIDEAIQLLFISGISYFTEPQNFYEVGTLTVVLSSILNIGDCKFLRKDDTCSVNLYLLILVVVFLTLNIISYARTVFLPFSEFYTGLVAIIQALAPFFLVTALIIVAFTAAYRLLVKYDSAYENAYPDCGKSFQECIISFVMHGFFAGLEKTERIPDILFGAFITIILLNVSIAIVSNSWSEAQKYARRNVWVHRIAFLSESGYFVECLQKLFLFEAIDKFRYIPLKSRAPWQQDPILKNVHTRDQYENPKEYFEEQSTVKTILESHSLLQSLHWIRKNDKKGKAKEYSFRESVWTVLLWLVHNTVYFVLVMIGIATLGILSPEDFRIWFF